LFPNREEAMPDVDDETVTATRRALEAFLDRLAEAMVDDLVRSESAAVLGEPKEASGLADGPTMAE
jgi:hypothetical protein